ERAAEGERRGLRTVEDGDVGAGLRAGGRDELGVHLVVRHEDVLDGDARVGVLEHLRVRVHQLDLVVGAEVVPDGQRLRVAAAAVTRVAAVATGGGAVLAGAAARGQGQGGDERR